MGISTENVKRIVVWLKPELLSRMDGWLETANCKNRSEFISKALRFYMGYLATDDVSSYVCECRRHNRSKELCPLPPIADATVKEAFRILHFKLKNHPEILAKTAASLTELRNRRMLWSPDIIELNKKISDILSQNQMLAVLKQQGLVDPDIFISKTNELAEQLRKLRLEKAHLLDSETDDPLSQTRHIIELLRDSPDFLEHYDEELFSELIENVIVKSRTDVRFRLKNGLELDEHIGRTLS